MQQGTEVWYYALPDGSAVGPLRKSELDRIARAGQLADSTLVWDGRSFEWRPLRQVSALSAAATNAAARERQTAVPKQPAPRAEARAAAASARAEGKPARKPAAPVTRTAASTVGREQPPPAPTLEPQADSAAVSRVAVALRRWLARALDLATSAVLALLLVTLAWTALDPVSAGGLRELQREPLLLAWLALLAWIPFEALTLFLFGSTPGKLAFGLRILDRRGEGPGLWTAWRRSWRVALQGMLLGLPPLTLLAQAWGFVRVVNDNQTAWDQHAGTRVEAAELGGLRWLQALAATAVAWILLLQGMTLMAFDGLLQELLPLAQRLVAG